MSFERISLILPVHQFRGEKADFNSRQGRVAERFAGHWCLLKAMEMVSVQDSTLGALGFCLSWSFCFVKSDKVPSTNFNSELSNRGFWGRIIENSSDCAFSPPKCCMLLC